MCPRQITCMCLAFRYMQFNIFYVTILRFILTFYWPCISVYLSQYLTNLMHKILFHSKFYFVSLHVSSTCAHHEEVKIALHSLWYHHTYRCDDTYCETKSCASSWLNTEINSTNVCAVTHEAKSTKMWRTLLLRSTKRVLFLIRQYVWYYAEIHTTDCVAIYLLN